MCLTDIVVARAHTEASRDNRQTKAATIEVDRGTPLNAAGGATAFGFDRQCHG
jgi:hypothetical protein